MAPTNFVKQIFVSSSFIGFLLLIGQANAQPEAFETKIAGIPITLVLLNLAVIIFLFGLVAKYVASKKRKLATGIGVFLVSLFIAASIPQTELDLIHVGDKSTLNRLYCYPMVASSNAPPAATGGKMPPSNDTTSNGISSTTNYCSVVITLNKSEIDSNAALKPLILDSQYYKPKTISYIQELMILYTLNSAGVGQGISSTDLSYNLYNYGHSVFLQYEGDNYYDIYLRGIQQNYEKMSLTYFMPELVLWNTTVTFFFFILLWMTPTIESKTQRSIMESAKNSLKVIAHFLSKRNLAKTAAVVVPVTVFVFWLYIYLDSFCSSSTNQSLYCWLEITYVKSIPFDMLIIANAYLVAIIITRLAYRYLAGRDGLIAVRSISKWIFFAGIGLALLDILLFISPTYTVTRCRFESCTFHEQLLGEIIRSLLLFDYTNVSLFWLGISISIVAFSGWLKTRRLLRLAK